MKIVFFSVTGQTRRFISKLNLQSVEITPTNPFIEVSEPYILVVPTYEKEITEPVEDFLNYSVNRKICLQSQAQVIAILPNFLFLQQKILPMTIKSLWCILLNLAVLLRMS